MPTLLRFAHGVGDCCPERITFFIPLVVIGRSQPVTSLADQQGG
ncbi:hypothetical protein ABZX30_15175 [Streptomyces sp. NPDC004542]